jgi:branched-subunit amino acid aminotransferase/4-amino-4-deoxychorismate lyase
MNNGAYILVNGTFMASADFSWSPMSVDNFLFSERIRSVRSVFPLFAETIDSIKLQLRLFNQSFPEFTENEGAGLKRQLERTLTKNKFFLGAVLTIRFWLADQKVQYAISCQKHEKANFELNSNGLYISLFSEIKKNYGLLSNLAVGSELIWKIAESHRDIYNADQLLILNEDDQIIEAIRANVYLVKKNEIMGAALHSGAYLDFTKKRLLKTFQQLGLNYHENSPMTEEDIREADEIFIASSVDGIQWVIGYMGKRYFNTITRKIHNQFINSLTN